MLLPAQVESVSLRAPPRLFCRTNARLGHRERPETRDVTRGGFPAPPSTGPRPPPRPAAQEPEPALPRAARPARESRSQQAAWGPRGGASTGAEPTLPVPIRCESARSCKAAEARATPPASPPPILVPVPVPVRAGGTEGPGLQTLVQRWSQGPGCAQHRPGGGRLGRTASGPVPKPRPHLHTSSRQSCWVPRSGLSTHLFRLRHRRGPSLASGLLSCATLARSLSSRAAQSRVPLERGPQSAGCPGPAGARRHRQSWDWRQPPRLPEQPG